jgi:hypothetical protein
VLLCPRLADDDAACPNAFGIEADFNDDNKDDDDAVTGMLFVLIALEFGV